MSDVRGVTLRVVQLLFGLILFGITLALFVRSGLGLALDITPVTHALGIQIALLLAAVVINGIAASDRSPATSSKFARVPSMRRAPA